MCVFASIPIGALSDARHAALKHHSYLGYLNTRPKHGDRDVAAGRSASLVKTLLIPAALSSYEDGSPAGGPDIAALHNEY